MKNIYVISILILNMSCDFFTKNNNHLKPKIQFEKFENLKSFDFGWLLLEPLNVGESKQEEIKLTKKLSKGQKALYFCWYLDSQVTNGGFVQFYYNEYNCYLPEIINGMELLGDTEMLNLINKAEILFSMNEKIFIEAKTTDSFGEEIYGKLKEFEKLDSEYYDLHEKTMNLIEKYARKNQSEFCVLEKSDK